MSHNKDYQLTESEHRDMQNLDTCHSAKAIIDKELIIFKPTVISDRQVIYLADRQTGKVFARYYEYAVEGTN